MNSFEKVPTELKKTGLFCVRRGKVPFTPGTDRHASPNDPTTFRDWDYTISHADGCDGIGILITGGIGGIDIDHCLTDGQFTDVAADMIKTLRCYTEKSPSGTGIHLLFRTSVEIDKTRFFTKHNGIEVYGIGDVRYLTLTGDCLYGAGLFETRDNEVRAVLEKYMRRPPEEKRGAAPLAVPVSLEDSELLERARNASNGEDFRRLFDSGDTTAYNGDDSAADLALCDLLAFWTGGDKYRMDSLFRQSALMRKKWDSKRGGSTYGWNTIGRAVQGCKEFYVPGKSPPEELMRDPEFLRLWKGENLPGKTTEECDIEMCSMLSPVCGRDKNKVDDLFRQSGRMREDWLRSDYRSVTLDKATAEERPRVRIYTAEELRAAEYSPVEYLIDGLLPAGTQGILTAPQKTGKSWMCLDIALSRAIGRPVLGHSVKQGNTLYLSLEDGVRRLSRRIKALTDEGEKLPPGVSLVTEFPTMSSKDFYGSMMDAIETTRAELVVIDVFQIIRDGGVKRNEDAYQKDYRELRALKRIFDKAGVALLLVHHPNKGKHSDDPHDSVSGSVAMTAVMDFAWTIVKDRNQETAYLNITGRDLLEQQLVISFDKDSCRWKSQGSADDFQQKLLEAKYDSSPIVKTIKLLLERDGKWTGTGEELRREATKRGLYISEERQALAKELGSLDGMLYDRDRIIHQRGYSGRSGAPHIFKRADLIPEFEEIGDEQQTPWDEQL